MCEALEARYLLTGISFVAREISLGEANGARSVYAADLDGDGDVDVLSASREDDKIAWYENTDGAGTFGKQQVISAKADGANSVFAVDVDSDGDVDVLSASWNDSKIAWYENTDGVGAFGEQRVITTEADDAHSVYAADFDGDGDMDVLWANFELLVTVKIAWHENTDGRGAFGEQQVISTDPSDAYSVYAADFDGDGDLDVLSAAGFIDGVAWYENTDGVGTFGDQQVITNKARYATSVYAADVDGDGDVDVLSASMGDGKIAWYKNTDGTGTFGPQQVITTEALGALSVHAADVDGDGDVDVLSASFFDGKIAWYENSDGAGTFSGQQIISAEALSATSVYAADVDGDGDVDVLSASSNDGKIAWYENRLAGDADDDGEVAFSDFLRLADNFGSVDAVWEDGDFDASGSVTFADFLILSSNFGESRPNQKPDANEDTESSRVTFSAVEQLSPAEGEATSMSLGDLDSDGDEDLLLASTNMLSWYENSGAGARFGQHHVIVAADNVGRNLYRSPSTADLDRDGDLDVLAADFRTGIVWFENIDGSTGFGAQQIIPIPFDEACSCFDEVFSVTADDLDGDGNADLLAVYDGAGVVWHENIDGAGSFGPQVRIGADRWPTHGDPSVRPVDLDGDGDLDVLAPGWSGFATLIWYENTDGSGDFGERHLIHGSTTQIKGVPVTIDVDGDGDVDILGAEGWFENVDGAATFVERDNQLYLDFGSLLTTADIDGDGDVDALWASRDKVVWAENTNNGDRWERETVIDSLGSRTFAAWGWPLLASDIDDDGDIDVLLIRPSGDKLVLLENA